MYREITLTMVGVSPGTQAMKTILDLRVKEITGQFADLTSPRAVNIIPLALIENLEVHVVDSVARDRVALVILSIHELVAEDFVVGFLRHLVDDDILLVVGDLEDDELVLVRLVSAHAELVERADDFVTDGNTSRSLSISIYVTASDKYDSIASGEDIGVSQTYPDASCNE